MSDRDIGKELEEAREEIRALQDELAATNMGLIALTAELEKKSEENAELSQQLWQSAKLAVIGELAASIAHELNNPLQIVSLRLESLMAEVSADDDRHRSFKIIEEEIDRVAHLVRNLLDFSRRTPMEESDVDLLGEVDKTLDLLHHHFRRHSIDVIVEAPGARPRIRADTQQLRQVLLNLFTNASDAMPQGGTLSIRASRTQDASFPVTVEVADTGVGIPCADLPRVCEPFFSTKPEGKGTGLGLAICRRIVKEHGGTLDITSELGVGTTVRIAFPGPNQGLGDWMG